MTSKLKPTIIQKGEYFIIKKAPGSRPASENYEKIWKRIEERIRRCSSSYTFVQKYLFSLPDITKGRLLNLAEEIAKRLNITVDRVAKRTKEPLICWYCENWKFIHTMIEPIYYEMFRRNIFTNHQQNVSPPEPATPVDPFAEFDLDFDVFSPSD